MKSFNDIYKLESAIERVVVTNRGLLVNRTAERVVRMLPPFTVTEAEIDEAVAILDAALTEAGR